ncbi:unnamed protein product [Menidia menidia]|uniref:(Atlantic silverside) hypothetical protein n=1 Tax=Menidia menidia TaxID=238744 RepID=A0A8S4B4K1_9TELE|nr:unnamed protein product [Menidia menidia]
MEGVFLPGSEPASGPGRAGGGTPVSAGDSELLHLPSDVHLKPVELQVLPEAGVFVEMQAMQQLLLLRSAALSRHGASVGLQAPGWR